MEILLESLDELEKNIQKLSVIDKEKYGYFSQKIQELRNKLIELEDTKPMSQPEINKIISSITKLELEFSNYMRTGNIEVVPGKLFFELPGQDNSELSGNEKIKRHRLGLLASTVGLVKKDVQLDFNKVEQAIEKFNVEKSNTDHEYSTVEIAYIDKLISELFIEYQKKYYKKNGTLPPEEASNYCNMDMYERLIRVMTSEKLIEEKERISRIESLILDGQVVNSNEIWNMLSGGTKVEETTTNLIPVNKQKASSSNQLIPVRTRKRINNKLLLTIREKNIFGNLVEKTKSIKLDIDGVIEIPEKMKKNLVRAILPEGISRINQYAFYDCINLSEVFIPESVIAMENNAFQNCRSLRNIELPENITSLGGECFCNSGLTSIKIPKNVIKIGVRAFCNCYNLKQVLLHEGLQQIGRESFYRTGIEAIKIPDSVKSVGDDALTCSYLDEISLPITLQDVIVKTVDGRKVPKIIIRVQDDVHNTSKKSTSGGIIIERE